MQLAARSYLTAGVALVGAGAIAVSPLAPPAPDVQIPAIDASSAAVNLTAAANPLQLWADVFEAAFQNIGGLGEQVLADPAPILTQIIANQLHSANVLGAATQRLVEGMSAALDPENFMSFPAALKQATDLIAAGDYAAGFAALASSPLMLGLPLIDFVGNEWVPGAWSVIAQPFTNLANLVTQLPQGLPALLANGVLAPLAGTAAATGYTLENLVAAANAGDAAEFVGTLVNAPATVTGALLNGFELPNDDGLPPTVFGGLLNAPDMWGTGGAISTVLTALSNLADALATPGADRADLFGSLPVLDRAPSETVAVNATLAPAAKTVTLDVAQTKELTAPAATSEAAPAVDVDEASAESDDAGAAPATPTKVSTKVSVKASPKAPAKVDSPAKAVRDQVKSAVSKVTGGLKKDKAGSEKAGADKAGTAKKADSSTGSAKDSD
ncbi:hypothetical protein H7H51_16580 [Mycolicibacterium farcinogenes]|nr:hypothetical protein [Mycolicibacterium farcinogenes]